MHPLESSPFLQESAGPGALLLYLGPTPISFSWNESTHRDTGSRPPTRVGSRYTELQYVRTGEIWSALYFSFRMARLGAAVTAVIFGLIIMRTMPAMAARSEFLRKTLESSDSDGSVLVVLPINILGLANRLRTLASVYSMMCRLREASEGRPFRLLTVWKSTDECPADYSDLFLPHRDENVVVESYDSLWRTDDHERSFEQTVREHVSSVLAEIPSSRGGVYSKQIYPQRGLLEEDFFYPVGDAATNISATRPIVLTVWTRGTHSLRSMHCKGFLFSKSLFYQGLVPVPVVASIIQKTLYGPSFSRGRQVVGIHTRAFDSEYDWAVVGPNGLGDELSLRFDEASPLDAFVFIMGEILKYEPSTLFFVASNSAVAKMELFHRFPHNSVTVHRSGLVDDREYRSTLSGMQFALAEFYLLGETGVIIHSRGSSFAREAAARLQRPVVDVNIWPFIMHI